MIRVTTIEENPGCLRLRLEGRLTRSTLEELEMECRRLMERTTSLAIDTAGLQFADEAGVSLLRRLDGEGVRLDGLTPLLEALLDEAETPAAQPPATTVAPPAAHAAAAEEGELVARLKAGDDDAFEEMVRAHGGRLLATASRMLPCKDDAGDVVQEALLLASRSIDSFEGMSRLSTWLHRIVVNVALMKIRSGRRRREEPIEDLLPRFAEDGHFAEPVAPWEGEAETLLSRQQTRAMVKRAIEQLPESYRTVLLLRDIEELDTDETAALLGMKTNAVKTRLHRARQALRTLIERQMATAAAGRHDC